MTTFLAWCVVLGGSAGAGLAAWCSLPPEDDDDAPDRYLDALDEEWAMRDAEDDGSR